MAPPSPRRSGYSLVELLVVIVVLGIVLGALLVSSTAMQRQLLTQRTRGSVSDALLAGETFLTTLLQGADANPYQVPTSLAFQELNAQPAGSGTPLAGYVWDGPSDVALAFDRVQIFSDFNPANRVQTDPFENVLVFVNHSTRELRVKWVTTAGGSEREDVIAAPIDSLRISYYDLLENPVTDATLIPRSKQVRFRLVTLVQANGRTTAVRRSRWVYIRNP